MSTQAIATKAGLELHKTDCGPIDGILWDVMTPAPHNWHASFTRAYQDEVLDNDDYSREKPLTPAQIRALAEWQEKFDI